MDPHNEHSPRFQVVKPIAQPLDASASSATTPAAPATNNNSGVGENSNTVYGEQGTGAAGDSQHMEVEPYSLPPEKLRVHATPESAQAAGVVPSATSSVSNFEGGGKEIPLIAPLPPAAPSAETVTQGGAQAPDEPSDNHSFVSVREDRPYDPQVTFAPVAHVSAPTSMPTQSAQMPSSNYQAAEAPQISPAQASPTPSGAKRGDDTYTLKEIAEMLGMDKQVSANISRITDLEDLREQSLATGAEQRLGVSSVPAGYTPPQTSDNVATDKNVNIQAAVELGTQLGSQFFPDKSQKQALMATMTRKERRQYKKDAKQSLAIEEQALRIKNNTQAAKNVSIRKQLKSRSKELSKRTTSQRFARKTAKDVLGYIGYNAMYQDGVCEVEEGLFSVSCWLSDTSYQTSRDETRLDMVNTLGRVYDQCGADTLIQVNLVNTPLLPEDIGHRRFFDPSIQLTDNARSDCQVFNNILNQKMREGVSNIKRDRYITFTSSADSVDDVVPKLSRLRVETSRLLNGIHSHVNDLEGAERLKVIQSQLRPMTPFNFSYNDDIGIAKGGMTTKDAIAPLTIDFKPNGYHDCFKTDGTWGQVLYVRKFGSEVNDNVLNNIVSLPIPLNITMFFQPIAQDEALTFLRQHGMWIDKEIIEEHKSTMRGGVYDPELIPENLKYSKNENKSMMQYLQEKNQRLYDFTGLIYTYAATYEQLQNQVMQIISAARQVSLEVDLLDFRQREAFNSILPLGHNHMDLSRKLTTAQISMMVPFAAQELDDPTGTYIAQNKYSSNLVIGDRKELASPMGYVCGKPGAGKGMAIKIEITGTLFKHPEDQIIVFDRAGEYCDIGRRYDGLIYDLNPLSQTYLNPLDTSDLSGQNLMYQVSFKADAILAQAAAAAAESNENLPQVDRTLISRCVELAFDTARKRGDGRPPILQDFYDALLEQKEDEARYIAMRYERFIKGSMSFLNHQSNVTLGDHNFVDINFRELPDTMTTFALIAACEAVRNQMYANFAAGRRTWLYIEEIQSLFGYPEVLKYFTRLVAEGRKFGLLMTGITQNTEILLKNDDAKLLVLNSDYILLLKQSPIDRLKWADLEDLSEQEADCIDETVEPGDGLLIFGDVRVPIRGRIPRGNVLYDLWSTNPNEAVEKVRRDEMAAREARRQQELRAHA